MTYPLPYSFARAHQLLLEDDGQRLCLSLSDASDRSALSEVTRKFAGQGLHLQPCTPAELAQRIHQAYSGGQAHGASMAAAVVNEVEAEADLSRMMQELPAVEDLLEASDDAPIIRMLNALLTQAARDGAATEALSRGRYEQMRINQQGFQPEATSTLPISGSAVLPALSPESQPATPPSVPSASRP